MTVHDDVLRLNNDSRFHDQVMETARCLAQLHECMASGKLAPEVVHDFATKVAAVTLRLLSEHNLYPEGEEYEEQEEA